SAFTAYFDASGHPSDQPFVVVSGYVANYLQWQGFGKAWAHTHNKFNVDLPFHMADFMARKKDGARRKDYKKLDDTQAEDFLVGLASVQEVYMLLRVSCIVDMGIYQNINDVF